MGISHATSDTNAPTAALPAPAAPANAVPPTFAQVALSVASAEVIVASPAADPLDSALAAMGGFPASADVNHAHRDVPHSFAVGYNAKGDAVVVVYLDDTGKAQVTMDPDAMAVYQHKAHRLVASAPGGSSDSDHSGPFGTSGGGMGGGGDDSATIRGEKIHVGMTKSEVRHKLGSPAAVFDEGTSHESWEIKPFNAGHTLVDSAVTQISSGFGIFGMTAYNAGSHVTPKAKTYMVRFNGDTVSHIMVISQ